MTTFCNGLNKAGIFDCDENAGQCKDCYIEDLELCVPDALRYRFLRNVADPSDWEYLSYQDEDVMDKQIDWEIEQRTE